MDQHSGRDRVLVNKLTTTCDVHRGDIVVFAAEPTSSGTGGIDDLVKRVMPGETVAQCSGERVCIDGKTDEGYLPGSFDLPDLMPKLSDGTTTCAPDSPEGGCRSRGWSS
jgi:hypothetical protein